MTIREMQKVLDAKFLYGEELEDLDVEFVFSADMTLEDATASVSIFSSGYSNSRPPIKYWFCVLLITTTSIPAAIRS